MSTPVTRDELRDELTQLEQRVDRPALTGGTVARLAEITASRVIDRR